MVLGHKIDGGGMRDGEEVLDLLARDPHTARHISLEIAQHFVSDNPPDALVNRMAQTYESRRRYPRRAAYDDLFTGILVAGEYRAKIKTPFELVASAARAVGRIRPPVDAGAMDRTDRRTALSMPASDGICR